MIQNPITAYMAAKQCRFTIRGQNLTELRRAKLRLIAKALKLPEAGATKNELLHRIVGKLSALGADSELGNI